MDFHLKEFDALHAQANRYVRELFALERYAVIGTVAVYAWLLVNKAIQMPFNPWYLPLIFGILGVLQLFAIGLQLICISGYLRRIEKKVFMSDRDLGWEEYWRQKNGPVLIIVSITVFWILMLCIQFLVPRWFQLPGLQP